MMRKNASNPQRPLQEESSTPRVAVPKVDKSKPARKSYKPRGILGVGFLVIASLVCYHRAPPLSNDLSPSTARGGTPSSSIASSTASPLPAPEAAVRPRNCSVDVPTNDADPLASLVRLRTPPKRVVPVNDPAQLVTLVWAVDRPPDPDRFSRTFASVVELHKSKPVHVRVFCGSTACLQAAQRATQEDTFSVELLRLNVLELAAGTPLEEWANFHVLAKLLAMQHYEKHLQAAMQLTALWRYGGRVLEPGYILSNMSSHTSSLNETIGACKPQSLATKGVGGFGALQAPSKHSSMAALLMNKLLEVYSWESLSAISPSSKDIDMPATPTTWPIDVDWDQIVLALEIPIFESCPFGQGFAPVEYADTSSDSAKTFFGTLSYDDRRRQLMAKHIPRMNIGDETQGLAGIQMLPRVDAFVERDVLTKVTFASSNNESSFRTTTDKVVVFLNAWYGIPLMKWPPPDYVAPVTLAMHFQERMYEKILELPKGSKAIPGALDEQNEQKKTGVITVQAKNGSNFDTTLAPFLRRNGPIGARDTKTLEYFQNHGIPSFFSACMTMTLGLQLPRQKSSREHILVIDAPNKEQLEAVVPAEILTNATILTQDLTGPLADTSISRYLYSFFRLLLYPRSKLIITARLHVALPAVALGTPVLFLQNEKLPGGGGHRLDGLDDFMHVVHGSVLPPCFDWLKPPPNPLPNDFQKYRNRLKQVAVCHPGVSDAARKFGVVPTAWDSGDEIPVCSSSDASLQDKDVIRIATTLDENYFELVFPSWINALSRSNGNAELELYIICVDLSGKQRCLLRTMVMRLLPRARVFTIPFDTMDFKAHYFNKGSHISIATQSRLRLPSLLPCIDKIAWIDLDAFVVDSLQEFWSYEVASCGITARTDAVLYLNTIELPNGIQWHDLYGYSFNAGVLLLSLDNLRLNRFEETIVQYWGIDLGFNDQVVLNMACNGTYGLLNETMNMMQFGDFSKAKKPNKNWVTTLYYPPPSEWVVVHFTSSRKPWSKNPHWMQAFNEVWSTHKLSYTDALDLDRVL